MIKTTLSKKFYNKLYLKKGVNAQRKYPNEELSRFMGRNLFWIPQEKRKKIKVLETGCGSGGNIGMIAKEGFEAHGIDNSQNAIDVCKKNLKSQNLNAKLRVLDMQNLNYKKNSIDIVVDIFSSCCLDQSGGLNYLKEVKKILKKDGIFFSYFPSKKSDTWLKEKSKKNKIDNFTLKGIFRKSAPYYGNNYSLRFLNSKEYVKILKNLKFKIKYLETTSRTYRSQKEYFEFIIVEARKV